ncbi:DUF6788 family protein [Caballeronia sordidicola]|uniref:DUF6788 family protein n=1 Tax=Caballeronia sordidicola TaxID=196367 RepID=UPI0035944E16
MLTIQKRHLQIATRIDTIKAKLAAIDEIRPGSLSCRYKDSANQSGAYYQLSYARDRKSRTDEYIERDPLSDVRCQIDNFNQFKALTEKWVDLSVEQSPIDVTGARRQLSEPDRITDNSIGVHDRQDETVRKAQELGTLERVNRFKKNNRNTVPPADQWPVCGRSVTVQVMPIASFVPTGI